MSKEYTCPYCQGAIPSKDFALKTPAENYFHFPCADKALDEWVELKALISEEFITQMRMIKDGNINEIIKRLEG